MEELIQKATALAGRDIEVEQTKDGKYIVLFMSMTEGPPPKGNTKEEALEGFIRWAESRSYKQLPDEVPEVGYDDDEDTGLPEAGVSVREEELPS